MRSALPVPSLARVPKQMLASFGGATGARLALDLLDEGILVAAAAPTHASNAHLAQGALRRWWPTQFEGLAALPRPYLHIAEQGEETGWSSAGGLWIHIGPPERDAAIRQFFLRDRCLVLERESQGLGAHAIRCLDLAQWHTGQVLTPHLAFGMASYVHWMGESDETEMREQLRDSGEEDPDLFTRAMFFEHMPEWAALPATRGELARWRPKTTPRSSRGREVLEACRCIVRLHADRRLEALERLDARHDGGGEWLAFAAVARWSRADYCMRVVDDWYQDAVQGDTWETFGSYRLDEARGELRTWLQHFAAWIELYLAMDRLLVLIGTPDE